MWVQIGGDCMAWPLGGCLVAGMNKKEWFCSAAKRAAVHSLPPVIRLAPFFVSTWTEWIVLWKMNLTTSSLVAMLPQSQEQKNACCCRQNVEHVSVQIPELESVWCIRHIHFTCKTLTSWLQLLLKCVKISCLQQELYIQKQGQDFPWKHSKCVYCWQWKGFYISFPYGGGGVWITGKGNGARRRLSLINFHSFPPGGSEQW